ncbi:ABC transporter related protein [Actinobacteria bacterium OV320]|nr:ABC transporter related protein [Actinobacteria bacterium OV320]
MGIDPRDVDQPIGTLSGGERQCVAIARAVYFGAKVLVLDEPTAALGVKQSGVVLNYVAAARDAGLGVVLITHNPHHAYLVGDRFVLLRRGATVGAPHYRFGSPAMGRLAFGVGMTFSPCRSHVLGGGVTGSGGIDRPLIRGMTTGFFVGREALRNVDVAIGAVDGRARTTEGRM